jgi:hypothetical protein
MGKRSRKRGETIAPPHPTAAEPVRARAAGVGGPRSRRARMDEAPKAPWSPFPLTEIVVLLALILLAVGFFSSGGRRGVLIGLGLVLASLAGGELALREHFAGFRSHTTLLAGTAGFLVGALAVVIGLSKIAVLVIAVVVAVVSFPLLRRAFMRRSGGLGFRA